MKSLIREFDVTGMQLAAMQANIFSDASKKGLGSYYFLRRFASSEYCEELDSLAIMRSSLVPDNFWEENEATISKNGMILPVDVMHWIGYIYRYWCYTEDIPLLRLIKQVTIKFMSSIYNAYHSLSPEEVVKHIKDILNIDEEERQKRVIEKYRLIFLDIIHKQLKDNKN